MLDFVDIPADLLPNRVDIYPAAVGQDIDGAYKPTYSAQPSWQNLPCNAQPRQGEEVFDEQNRISRVKHYHVFFNGNPNVTPRDKLVVTDPDGTTHILYVEADRNEGGFSVYYVIRCIERL
jgi:hypothetical protein